MIDVKTLRCGNLLQFKGEPFEVYAISTNGTVAKSQSHLGYSLEYVEPIPLTEEWLVKLSLTEYSRTEFWANYMTDKRLNVSVCLQEYLHYKEGLVYVGVADTEVTYLHQLQNLISALTGTELKAQD